LGAKHTVAVIIAVFLIRAAATSVAVGGGGGGGLFIPLVVQGAVLGSAVSTLFGVHDTTLFPLLGVAAFLGAGYRVPLAAVVFVAETTGRPGFVVPGLVAAATSQLLMASSSVSPYQRDVRTGTLERRLALPVSAALRTDISTVPSDASIAELFTHHIREVRLRTVPVVDGSRFLGMVTLDDVVRLPRERWSTTTAGELARGGWPVADLSSTLADAVTEMERHDVDRIAILDGAGFVGIVTTGEVLKLDAIPETTTETGLGTSPRSPLAAPG
jgi:CBS domain-containing protein